MLGFPAPRLARTIACTAFFLAGPVVAPAAWAAACDEVANEAAIAAARAAVASSCDCAAATKVAEWRRCVRDVLDPLVADGAISPACQRLVRRIEQRSTCGRPGRVVCCVTLPSGRTVARMRPAGRCTAPRNGSFCESPLPHLDDACTETGCNVPTCGNGVVETGEGCDPPDGTTCNAACESCAEVAGEVAVSCEEAASGVSASATPDTFLVAYTELATGLGRVLAKRLDGGGALVDAAPLEVSEVLVDEELGPSSSSLSTVVADGGAFHVGLSTFVGYAIELGTRRVPASGAIVDPRDVVVSDFPVGFCGSRVAAPIGIAPTLDGSALHATFRTVFYCGADVLFEVLTGLVPGWFAVPPPGNVSFSGAPLARGSNDVAGVWSNALLPDIEPPVTFLHTLHAAWLEPGPPTALSLTTLDRPVSPALAAAGDTFLAVWAARENPGDPVPTEVRGIRFSRAGGVLDPAGGFLVAAGSGQVASVSIAARGSSFLVAWREQRPAGTAIRAIHVGDDGSLLDASPLEVATSDDAAGVAAAAGDAAELVAFSRAEASGAVSIRGVLLPTE